MANALIWVFAAFLLLVVHSLTFLLIPEADRRKESVFFHDTDGETESERDKSLFSAG